MLESRILLKGQTDAFSKKIQISSFISFWWK